MMDIYTLAEQLNGVEYGKLSLSDEQEEFCVDNNILVICGCSDDGNLIMGAYDDHVDAWEGATFLIDHIGVKPTWDKGESKDFEDAKLFFGRLPNPSFTITSKWCALKGYCWSFEVDNHDRSVEYTHFDMLDNGETWCKCLVLDISSIVPQVANDK